MNELNERMIIELKALSKSMKSSALNLNALGEYTENALSKRTMFFHSEELQCAALTLDTWIVGLEEMRE
jgi:hypothetical protein